MMLVHNEPDLRKYIRDAIEVSAGAVSSTGVSRSTGVPPVGPSGVSPDPAPKSTAPPHPAGEAGRSTGVPPDPPSSPSTKTAPSNERAATSPTGNNPGPLISSLSASPTPSPPASRNNGERSWKRFAKPIRNHGTPPPNSNMPPVSRTPGRNGSTKAMASVCSNSQPQPRLS
jgi:hypothetical protein